MKKATKILAGAALIVSLSALSGCTTKEIVDDPPYAVYGPPPTPELETEMPAVPTPEETVFTPVPDPATEPVEEVYGPPLDEMDMQDNW